MKYQVEHTTTYRYTDPVSLGHNEVHLAPREFNRQRCLAHRLSVRPAPTAQRSRQDYFGNRVDYFTLEEEHRELTITASSTVQLTVTPPPPAAETRPWEEVRDRLQRCDDAPILAAAPFVVESPYVRFDDAVGEYGRMSFTPGRPILEAALDLTQRIHREFKYSPATTQVNTPSREVLDKRRGVCQDFAHLQLVCLRWLGLAARYVSGYLLTDPPPGQPRMVGVDASHAWLSIFCLDHGWVDLDPTNNQIPSDRHITLGWARDYGDVCPIKGVFLGGGPHVMTVAVDVVPTADS